MKKHLFILSALIFSSCTLALAQTKVEKYCTVLINRKAKISLGLKKELFAPNDTSVLRKLNYVNQLTTETDVLNYMNGLGWTPVNMHAVGLYTATEIIYFKKEFDRSEFKELAAK